MVIIHYIIFLVGFGLLFRRSTGVSQQWAASFWYKCFFFIVTFSRCLFEHLYGTKDRNSVRVGTFVCARCIHSKMVCPITKTITEFIWMAQIRDKFLILSIRKKNCLRSNVILPFYYRDKLVASSLQCRTHLNSNRWLMIDSMPGIPLVFLSNLNQMFQIKGDLVWLKRKKRYFI